MNIKGVWAAVMTPFKEDGTVCGQTMEKFMKFYLEKGLDGIFPASNVGEFAALSFEERCEIIRICTSMGKSKMNIFPGVTDLNLNQSIKLADFAAKQGADGVVVSTPYYYPYGNEFVESYLRIFIKESPLPVMLYHSPRFSAPVSEELLLELLAEPKVVAVKESSGEVRFLLSLMERIKARGIDAKVMVGWEELLLTGLVHGASGCITSCGGIVPEILKEIYGRFMQGDIPGAMRCQESICRITRVLGKYGFPGGYKMGMAARVPCRILQSSRMQELEEKLQNGSREVQELIKRELSRMVEEMIVKELKMR